MQDSPVRRFELSMGIDYEKWHDGVGYDLDAIRLASAAERKEIEGMLISRGANDWRDVEALAVLDTMRGNEALRQAAENGDASVRMAVSKHAPGILGEEDKKASLLRALREAEFYGGLTQALDEVVGFHPPEVLEALFRGALERSGDVAVHFAAMLAYLHGRANEPFDMEMRPFFLRFATESAGARRVAFRDLCGLLGVDPRSHLKTGGKGL